MRRWAAALALLSAISLPGLARPAQQDFRIDVDRVLVDCVVLDEEGRLVVDLLPSDFRLYDGDEPVEITYFQREGYVARLPDEEVRANVDFTGYERFPRDLVVFFDGLNTGPTQLRRLRPALHGFVDRLGPSDRAMLVTLTPQRRLLVVVPFPGDPARLHEAIDELGADPNVDGVVQRREQTLLYELYRDPEGSLNQEISKIQNAVAHVRAFAGADEDRTLTTLGAIEAFGRTVARRRIHPGPVFLLLISGGTPLRPGAAWLEIVNRHVDEVNQHINRNLEGSQTPPPVFREQADVDLTPELQRVAASLAGGNVVVYGLDAGGTPTRSDEGADAYYRSRLPPGLQMEPYRQRKFVLAKLSEETGGEAFLNSSNWSAALERVLVESSFRYVLGFRVSGNHEPGEFVPLRVEVERPELRVRHRRGYIASR